MAKHERKQRRRVPWQGVACLAAFLVGLQLATADATAPSDHRVVGRTETCVLNASSECTINHGFGEDPTAVEVQNSTIAIVAVDTNLVTDTSYRVKFVQHNGANFANGTTARFNVIYTFGPPDTTPPDTSITSGPSGTTESTSASFGFTSTETPSTFECKLDAGAFASCTTPKAYSGLAVGVHTFEVKAKDAAGNEDATPAARTWEIVAPPPPPPGTAPSWDPNGTYTATFSDEFNDTVVDSTKWEKGWFGEGITSGVNDSNDNCYDTAQVSESGGFLRLGAIEQAVTCSKGPEPYRSGIVTSRNKFSQRFGSFEARVCLPDADSNGLVDNFPAWWLNGTSGWPNHGEIDVVEGIGGGRTKSSLHYTYPGTTEFHGGQYSQTIHVGCHNFGVKWTASPAPGQTTFYYDGLPLRDGSGQIWTHEFDGPENLWLILNHAVDDSHSPTVIPSEMTVDWVRVWQ